jgi:Protein of unknown function DUF262/Protein of unknown function (DUF1524)
MVVYPETEGSNRWYVVDGQQRLTTITILLCIIRDIISDLEPELAKGIHGLIERRDINNKTQHVLYAETSYPYFQDHIQKFGEPDSDPEVGEEERAIALAARLFRQNVDDSIKAVDKQHALKVLTRLRDRILNLKVIVIELDNEDDAYLIFETLNTRGKDLEVSDLLKNLLTKYLKAKNSQNDTIKEKWKLLGRIANGLTSDIDLNSYIHHHWLSSKEYIAEKKLFKSLKSTINTRDAAKNYLNQLAKEVTLYKAIFTPKDHKFSADEKNLARSLEALQVFRVRQPVPMMLSVLSAYQSKKLSKPQVDNFFRRLENFHFLFTAVTSQRSSGGISLMYSKSARELRNAIDKDAGQQVIKQLVTKLLERAPDEQSFKIGFNDIKYSDSFPRQKTLARYILQKIHQNLSENTATDYSQYSIEHLESQSSTKLSDEAIASIGNLIFVPKDFNSEKLKNKPFSEKKRLLIKSGIPLDQTLTDATTWDSKVIAKRQEELANLAYNKVWKL